jgi:hypothetical protein
MRRSRGDDGSVAKLPGGGWWTDQTQLSPGRTSHQYPLEEEFWAALMHIAAKRISH